MGFLAPQLHRFSHGSVSILWSEGLHHRNNIHLAPAKSILATCKTITKLPLICVCFLTVEFRVCGGGVQTALEACTSLPVMVTPEKREKATERKEYSWGKEHGTCIWTNPSHQHCKEEQGAEFKTSLGTGLGSNGKNFWMCSTTAVWASCWQGLPMVAFACYAALSPFLNVPSRLVPLQGTKPIHTPNLFSSVSSRVDVDLRC